MGHKTENVELTVLCLIQDGNRVLLQNRVKEDWKGYTFPGGVVSSDEGEMEWIDIDRLDEINVVEDFRDLMKVLNDPDLNEFQYTVEGDEWIVHLK